MDTQLPPRPSSMESVEASYDGTTEDTMGTSNRQALICRLQAFDNHPTPLRKDLQIAEIENFAATLAQKSHPADMSPSTLGFVNAVDVLKKPSNGSVLDRPKMMHDVAETFLRRPATAQQETSKYNGGTELFGPETISTRKSTDSIFGGGLPEKGSGQRKRDKDGYYTGITVEEYTSYTLALCEAVGLGPNCKNENSYETPNGYYVKNFICKHEQSCQFRCRVFHPIDSDPNLLRYVGPAGLQTSTPHSCGKSIEWSEHLVAIGVTKSTTGLHPQLKDAVQRIAGTDIFRLPKPDVVFRTLLLEFGDKVKALFPPGPCFAIVQNQIKEYWRNKRRSMLAKYSLGKGMRVQYIQDIAHFSKKHELKLPPNYKPPTRVLLDPTEIQDHMKHIVKEGVMDPLPNPLSKTEATQHQMFCLPIPPVTTPHYGPFLQQAIALDPGSDTRKNMVSFSSFHLLRQVHLAHKTFNDNMMACIDSSHGSDASGGKLMSFGFVSMKWNGKGSEYRRKYYPLVFARVLEECQSAALFMLASLGWACERLFGVILNVKGGLISDHANSFVNAFRIFFHKQPIGQCFPHISMQVKDQSGLRKRGTPGYLKYIRDRLNLDIIHLDVNRMHTCTTAAMMSCFIQLCLDYWHTVLHEDKVADTFDSSYVKSEPHSHFRYNEFGNAGDTPQCNSIERFHLAAKGTREFDGYCNFGLTLDQMLHSEFPKLVSTISSTVGDIERAIRLFDQTACENDSSLMDFASKMTEGDWMKSGNGQMYFCNNVGFVGYPLHAERIASWKKAREGKFGGNSSKRLEFWEAGTSVCILQEVKRPLDNKSYWECDCPTFWKTTACCHSYIRQYGSVVKLNKRVTRAIVERKRRLEDLSLNKKDRTSIKRRYQWDTGFDEVI
jgi:hypothetical protein